MQVLQLQKCEPELICAEDALVIRHIDTDHEFNTATLFVVVGKSTTNGAGVFVRPFEDGYLQDGLEFVDLTKTDFAYVGKYVPGKPSFLGLVPPGPGYIKGPGADLAV
jgi:hypothetical protein